MVPRSSLSVLLASLALLVLASPAGAVGTPIGEAPNNLFFGHDDTRDGTANELISGLYPGDDGNNANGDPLAPSDRRANSWEAFSFTVPEGTSVGSFTVGINWQSPWVDFDLYVYRQRTSDGTLVASSLRSSASGPPDTSEETTYFPDISGGTVAAGTYVIVVDNWCTSNTDPTPGSAGCLTDGSGAPITVPDEDDFTGFVTFGAQLVGAVLPTITSLDGPDSGTVGQPLTYTASATDDGRVANYSFDLDGDGRFEYDAGPPTPSGASAPVTTSFARPGRYNIGVRVTDNGGGRSYRSKPVAITSASVVATPGGTATSPSGVPAALLQSFKLGRPVFGGTSGRSLVIRFRLRQAAKVTLTLYRANKRLKTLVNGNRAADRSYRIVLRPRGLKPGSYRLRLDATSRDRKQSVVLSAKRL